MDHALAPANLLAGMPDPESVRALESIMLQLPQRKLDVSHVVHGGMCARSMFIPAGTVLTGALTNCDNICVVFGDITVTTDDGPQHIVGFHVLPAKAGAKRAGVTHGDTWWTTIHCTEYTDIAAIEDEMTSESSMLLTRREGIEYEQTPLIEGVTR